jgi:eukaryotic-like serine/threonine-protein kinase
VVGKTVGNYKVLAQIGEGGMGAVYLAEHPLIGKKVAIKVLHAELSRVQDAVSRFFTEARAVNAIGHENIIDIADFGSMPEGETYFIMELLEGDTLAQRLRKGGTMTVPVAMEIIGQVCSALSAAHAHGIIHRDLKPDNIFLVRRGGRDTFVKVLDFGIAKLIVDTPGSAKTRTGVVIGTPHYMSPEQCTGKGVIDARSDIYSVGLIIYEMLTGRLPFDAESFAELLVAHLTQAPTPPRALNYSIPEEVQTVILKCLEKDRDKRYPNVDALAEALAQAVPNAKTTFRPGPIGATSAAPTLAATAATAIGMPMVTGMSPAPSTPTAQAPAAAPMTAPMAASVQQTTLSASVGQVQVPTTSGLAPAPAARKSIVPLAAAAAGGGLAIVFAVMFFMRGSSAPPAAPALSPAPVAASTPTPAPAAAAPTPAPAAAPAPAKTTVSVVVESTPKGAGIYRVSDNVLLGQTPATLDLPRGSTPVALELRLDGYKSTPAPVTPDRNVELSVVLPREQEAAAPRPAQHALRRRPAARPAPAGGKPKRPTDSEGTLEPEF